MNRLKKIWKPLVLVLIGLVIAADFYFDFRSNQANPVIPVSDDLSDLRVGTAVGERAPDFSGTTLDGKTIQLADLRGKTVLVNAFASWCGPCLVETPHLVEVAIESGEDVVVIGLNQRESPGAVESYQRDFQVPYPLVLNQDGRLTEIYRPIGLPTSWFIDPDGVIRYVHSGPMTTEMIKDAIGDVRLGLQPNPFSSN
jgi:thiol-disulfide isomerase/thioredoxin